MRLRVMFYWRAAKVLPSLLALVWRCAIVWYDPKSTFTQDLDRVPGARLEFDRILDRIYAPPFENWRTTLRRAGIQ